MELLFILDYVDFPLAVNPVLVCRVADVLAADNHSVHLLRLWNGKTPLPKPPVGCAVHDVAFSDEWLMEQCLEGGRKAPTPLPLRLARLACHPTAVGAAVRKLVLHRPRREGAVRRVAEALYRKYRFDAVIAVCAPYHAAFALAEAQLPSSCRRITWQMDPYSANREYTAPGGSTRELAMYRAMHHCFITKLMEDDYTHEPLAPARGKVEILDFPSLIPTEVRGSAHDGIRCVFAGSLSAIRSPAYCLQLFTALNAPDVTLTMLGGGWNHFPGEMVQAARGALGQRLNITGPRPLQEARGQIAGADILVNLGNTVDNQLPSKLFEYFGTGKPVLHLAQSEADPCLPYLARYPLALVLQASTPVEEAVPILNRWLRSVQGKRLPFSQVTALFPDNTPAAVAAALLRGI